MLSLHIGMDCDPFQKLGFLLGFSYVNAGLVHKMFPKLLIRVMYRNERNTAKKLFSFLWKYDRIDGN